MDKRLTDEEIEYIYRDTFNSWPDRKRDAPAVPPMAIAFGRAVEAALMAHLAQRPTSEAGWKLVPVTPTTEMVAAGFSWTRSPYAVYRAMLAAAPSQAAPAAEGQTLVAPAIPGVRGPRPFVAPSGAVNVCRDHDAACAEVPAGLRCSNCPERPASPTPAAPAVPSRLGEHNGGDYDTRHQVHEAPAVPEASMDGQPMGDPHPIDVAALDAVLSAADVHAEESREDGRRVFDRGGLIAFVRDIASGVKGPERCAGCDLPNGHPEYCRCDHSPDAGKMVAPGVKACPHGVEDGACKECYAYDTAPTDGGQHE